MIIARFLNNTVEIVDASNGRACIRTLDGSKPFAAYVARSDPEEAPTPATTVTDWAWVGCEELDGILIVPNTVYCLALYPIDVVRTRWDAVVIIARKVSEVWQRIQG